MKRKNYPLPRRILRFLKRQFRNPRKRLLAELAAVVVIIGIVIFIALSGQNIATDDIKEGRAYIEGLEAADTASIEEQVKELRKEERKGRSGKRGSGRMVPVYRYCHSGRFPGSWFFCLQPGRRKQGFGLSRRHHKEH